MKSHTDTTAPPTPGNINLLAVLGARLTWVLLGPAVLLLTTLGIVANGTGWLTGLDAFYGVVVGLMLLGRWVEYRSGTATSVTGEATTEAEFRQYMALTPVAAAAVWIAANTIGNHVLG